MAAQLSITEQFNHRGLQVVVAPLPHGIVGGSLMPGVGGGGILHPSLELVAVLVHRQVLAQDVGGLGVALRLQLAAGDLANAGDGGDRLPLHGLGAEGLVLLGRGRHGWQQRFGKAVGGFCARVPQTTCGHFSRAASFG